MPVLLVLTNAPDAAVADRIATALVERGLAACVNMLSPCTSIYRWQEKLERASEIPLLIKTTEAQYPNLERALCEMHPYELPEIIAVPITRGLPGYLAWVETQVRPQVSANQCSGKA
jgi:periplasmic divalent cation tolerance protein